MTIVSPWQIWIRKLWKSWRETLWITPQMVVEDEVPNFCRTTGISWYLYTCAATANCMNATPAEIWVESNALKAAVLQTEKDDLLQKLQEVPHWPWTLLSWDGPDGPDGPLTDPSRRALRLSSASAMTWKMNRRGAELTCGSASWSTPPHVQNNTRCVTRYGMCRINQYVFSWVYWPPCHRLFFNDSLRLNMWSFQSSACGLVHLKVRYVGQSMPKSRWEGSTCRSRAEAWRGWLEMSAVLVWNQGSAKLGSPDWQWLV